MGALRVRQRSILIGFDYQVWDDADQPVADLVWPDFAQAKNARLRWHAEGSPLGDVQVRFALGVRHEDCRIGFEFLSRTWRNDVRFTLHRGGEPLAVAEVRFPPQRLKRPSIGMHLPVRASLVRDFRWGRVRYQWVQDDRCSGSVEEPGWFSIKRHLLIDVPSTLALPVQVFIAFLAINDAFR